jgi:hypothetical protein
MVNGIYKKGKKGAELFSRKKGADLFSDLFSGKKVENKSVPFFFFLDWLQTVNCRAPVNSESIH